MTLRTVLSAIVKVLFPLPLSLLGVAVGLDIVPGLVVGEGESECGVVVVVPDSSLGVDVITPGVVFEVKRVVGGDAPTKSELFVTIVVGSAKEVLTEAPVVGDERASVVVSMLVSASVDVEVVSVVGVVMLSSGGNSTGGKISGGS